jgi:hypothetical protein
MPSWFQFNMAVCLFYAASGNFKIKITLPTGVIDLRHLVFIFCSLGLKGWGFLYKQRAAILV